ncbi:SusC/RagA family TonB-linked outer membrane protein [Paludibacter jiangxiensis]|nr:TonB-dependent receptor [Paludibacter jiangxiensis]
MTVGFAQQGSAHKVTGTVVDSSTGESLPGVNIIILGAKVKTGVISDIDGRFTINVSPDATLEFSYVGYQKKNVAIANKSVLNVTLESDVKKLDEVVVVGYGTMKKSDLSGAVSSVRSDALKNLATSDAAAAIQGKVSGVQVLTNSGAPGQGATIRVRGYSSNSGSIGPLLIVDGLKVDNIQYLDPSMIESMEILKDAASAAIYGAEAGNGVVLITTKSGAKGTSSISYDVNLISQSLGRHAKLFNAQDFIAYKTLSGLPIQNQLTQNKYDGTDTDWSKVVFGPAFSQQHTVTFQGGNNQGHFFTSLNVTNNNGIVRGDKDVYKRITGQVNADYNIKPWLQIGGNNSFEYWNTKSVSQMSQYGSLMNCVMQMDPLTPVYYSSPDQFASGTLQAYNAGKNVLKDPTNGLYYATSKYVIDNNGNPLLQRDRTEASSGGINLRGILYGNFKPVKGLVVTSRFGYRVSQSTSHSYSTPYYATSQANSNDYSISANANTSYYYQWENFANYNFTIDKHNITAMGGMSYIENNWDNVSASASGPDILKGYDANFRFLDYVNSNDKTVKSFGNTPGKSSQMGYYGRLSYSYDNKYMIQSNFRADAFDSSKLSKTNRWGYFPSFSGAWTVSNEKFFQNLIDDKIFSFLKVRGSWGQNGNINVLSGYQYSTTINYNGSWYQYGVDSPTPSYGSSPSGLANPNLKWETSEQLDFGVEMRFLKDKLSLNAGYYNKKTKDLLVSIAPVAEVGIGSTTINGGNVLNRGFEFDATWKDNIGKDFTYSVKANLTTLHNEVTYLDPSISRISGTSAGNNDIYTAFEVGQPIWYLRGYKYLGVNQKTGAPIYQTKNADGVPTSNDMTYIGKAIPDFTYGLTINLAYKGFDMNMFGTGVTGNSILNMAYRADSPMTNSLKYYYDHAWTTTNTNGSMPDPAKVVNSRIFWSSSASIFNGAYFKIKQIQLGYTLPASVSKKFLISKLRCYVSLDDFFTFASYPGGDPETATTSTASSAGFDMGTYPVAKKVTFGLNMTF